MTVAALKMFGLIEDSGSGAGRKVQLTESALKIIRDPRQESPERNDLIKTAAITPAIHWNVHDKYKGPPPSEEAFKAYLLMDLGMRDDATDAFVREYNETMSFAGLGSSGMIQDMEQNIHKELPESKQPRAAMRATRVATATRHVFYGGGPPAAFGRSLGGNLSLEPSELNDVKIFHDGDQLRLNAWINREGLEKLKRFIALYENMLATPPERAVATSEPSDNQESDN